MIKVNEYIQTGFSTEDAIKLLSVIQPLVDQKQRVELDFSGIKIFTTLFFNNALAKFLVEFGPEKYCEMFKVTNISELGQSTYQHSVDNAKEYYKLPSNKKTIQNEIISHFDE